MTSAEEIRENYIKGQAGYFKSLERDLKRYASAKLTKAEYSAIVEIREACNRIIEDELCRG